MNPVTIGIIGGKGAMGSWFKRYFLNSGCRVLISDLDTELTNEKLARQSDVVVLSTPIDIAIQLAKEIGTILKKEQLLIDFCSQKEDIVNAMAKFANSEVIGVHPMFGPFTNSIKGQNIILCPVKDSDWLNWLKKIFTDMGAVVTSMPADSHDKHMAVAQGLTHLLSISMGRMLQKMNLTPEKAFICSTPIFRLNIDLIGRLFAQDLDLYATLVGNNKYVKDSMEDFFNIMNEAKQNLLSNDKQKGIEFLEDIRDFFGDFCAQGLEESNEFLKVLFSEKN